MQPTFYKIQTIGAGFIATMARPRADDRAETEFENFAAAGIQRIVSLLEVHEEYVLGLEKEAELAATADIEFTSFPIPDRGVPASLLALAELSLDLHQDIAAGRNTAIHCRSGIGRSSLVAAAVLLQAGVDADEAFKRIGEARGLAVPETEEQAQWLRDNSRNIVAAGVANTALH